MYVIFWQHNKDEPMFNAVFFMIFWDRQYSAAVRETS